MKTADIVLNVHVDADGAHQVVLDGARWPEQALFADCVLRRAPELFELRYPLLTLRLDNGHAVYRVDTCERGLWTGELVEGWVDREAP